MATIQIKCPNCGATPRIEGNLLICEYCNSITMRIFSSDAAFNATEMDLQNFRTALENNKRDFFIRINSVIRATDVDSLILNKRLDMATQALKSAAYDQVPSILSTVRGEFAAERLVLLARYRAQSEQQIAMMAIEPDFSALYPLCDEETKNTYREIEKICRKNVRLQEMVNKGYELLSLNMQDEAVAYGKKLCNEFPDKACVWDFAAIAVNRKAGTPKNTLPVGKEMQFMMQCPDYGIYTPQLFRHYRSPAEQAVLDDERAQRQQRLHSLRKKALVQTIVSTLIIALLDMGACLMTKSESLLSMAVLSLGFIMAAIVYGIFSTRKLMSLYEDSEIRPVPRTLLSIFAILRVFIVIAAYMYCMYVYGG